MQVTSDADARGLNIEAETRGKDDIRAMGGFFTEKLGIVVFADEDASYVGGREDVSYIYSSVVLSSMLVNYVHSSVVVSSNAVSMSNFSDCST